MMNFVVDVIEIASQIIFESLFTNFRKSIGSVIL